MPEKKKPVKKQTRGVSKPRILKAIWDVTDAHGMKDSDPISTLIEFIKDDIVADAVKE